MNKWMSLIFSVTAILMLILAGVSLSYQKTFLALGCFILFFAILAVGFMIKGKLQRNEKL